MTKKRRKWMRRAAVVLLILVAGGIGLFGCGGLYLVKLGVGQARILLGREPIAEVLADPAVDPGVKEKLRLILEVREFAEKDLGLDAEGQYRYYYDTGGRPIVYTITACPKDRLEACTWSFPIVGEVAYKGFFDKEDALEARDDLERRGFDTNVGGAQAFSTLGWFSDPVFTSMLGRRHEMVVETVIHELTHATIYVKGQTPFNESLATFVGINGAVEFLSRRHGPDSEDVRFARALRSERQAFSGVIKDLEDELNTLYDEEISLEEKLARREEVFRKSQERVAASDDFQTDEFAFYPRLALNNAVVLSLLYYHNRIGIFEEVLEEEGGDLQATVARVVADPEAMLQRWIEEEDAQGEDD